MMRLRRLELVFVGLTLAFLIFMGGFFTGRSHSSVNIEGVASLQVETTRAVDVAEVAAQPSANDSGSLPPTSGGYYESGNYGINLTVESSVVDAVSGASQDNSNQPAVAPGAPRGGDGRININTASKNELMDLPGIGPSLAENIVQHRNNNGAFNSIEDIMNVSCIAQGRFDRIKDRITV